MPAQDLHKRYGSGTPWEAAVGYSRVVRAGNHIEISGTVAAGNDGIVLHHGDAYAQTIFILSRMERALQQAGATLADVVRTRMFVTDISRWQEFGKAHGEIFGAIRPCTSMLEVRALIDPACLIEIEVTAIISP